MEYFYPSTIGEACRLLEEGCIPIAGGTEINLKHVDAQNLVDINALGLDYVEERGEQIAIGAAVTISEIEGSSLLERYRALRLAAESFTQSVKHLATVGGNIAESVPSSDMAPPLMVFDAMAVIAGSKGERVVQIEDLFSGIRRNSLKKGEMIKEFLLPSFEGRSFFRKVGRTEDDLALTSIALCADGRNRIRIALGSAASVPFRAKKTESAILMSGIEGAYDVLLSETEPRSSIRASAEYRKKLEVELLGEALNACEVRL